MEFLIVILFLPKDLIKEHFVLSDQSKLEGVNFDIWCKK